MTTTATNRNAALVKLGNRFFLDFFNSKEVYSIKGFDTERKAKNYAKKYGYTLHDKLPAHIHEFIYND